MALTWASAKDPADELDWTVDWSQVLADGETIDTVTWDVPTGLTEGSNNVDGAKTIVWISGGTAGTVYSVTVTIDTSQGRTYQRTIRMKVKER